MSGQGGRAHERNYSVAQTAQRCVELTQIEDSRAQARLKGLFRCIATY